MTAKKVPAKKAATKKVAAKKAAVKQAKKSAPAKKQPAKKAIAPTPKASASGAGVTLAKKSAQATPAKKAPKTPPVKAPKDKPKAVQSHAPIDPNREKRNGVLHPAPRTISGDLWAICDKLQEKLGRAPARFEYREKVELANVKRVEAGGKPYDFNSVSFQYFNWRKFHGVPAHAAGLYPKRGKFEISTNKAEKEAAKSAAQAKREAKAEKPAPKAKEAPAKAPAKKAAKVAPAPAAPASETPGVSSRLAGVSEAAAHSA